MKNKCRLSRSNVERGTTFPPEAREADEKLILICTIVPNECAKLMATMLISPTDVET